MVSRSRPRLRGPLVAAAASAALLISSAVVAAPLAQPHTFDSDAEGWYAYGHQSEGVVDGQFCATVDPEHADAASDAWDAAVQHDAVAFESGETYTISFTASSSIPTTVPLQMGGVWPDVQQEFPALTAEPTEFSYTFTPTFDAPAGQIGFQIGGKGELTFCLDDVSLSGDVELLPTTDFSEGQGAWGVSENVTASVEDGEFCLAAPAGTANPWDALTSFDGVPIVKDSNYELRFTARASREVNVRALVGEAGGTYRTVLDQSPAIGTELAEYALPFAAVFDFPAEAGDAPVGQVAFQFGGKGEVTFCLTSVSLVKLASPPPPYSPDTRSPVRVNQHGYLPGGPKQATVVADASAPLAWELRDAADAVVASGTTTPRGRDASTDLDVHTLDFSQVTTKGADFTVVVGEDRSDPFDIDADLYQQLRRDALNYFYLARSGIEIEADIVGEKYARAAGHVSTPGGEGNQGDVDVPCIGPRDYYDGWTCDYTLDVTGGWYDAGDHGKYVVNGGISVAQLLSTYERATLAPTGTPAALGDGTLDVPESANGVPDVLDEARWELEWMLKMIVPAGEPLAGMVHHKIHDECWTGLPLAPADATQVRSLHRPSTAATLNVAAVAAQGARLFAEIDPEFSAELLEAARTTWDAAKTQPVLYAPAAAGNDGGGPYDDTDITDETYWAAAELFLTTGEKTFRDAVEKSPHHDGDVFPTGGFFWGQTAALGRISLALVPSALPDVDEVRASVVEGATAYLADQATQPFGTPYVPEDGTYAWGSSSAVVNTAVVLGAAYDLTGEDRFRDGVLLSLDYLLGRNGLNQSYVTGYGEKFSKNQHSRWFSNQLDATLPNPPAGSLAGGPNSDSPTWDPTMQATFTEGCAPAMCYLDEIQSWASNEITVNWNSALSWLASFAADQEGADDTVTTAPAFTRQPVAQTVADGARATFTVSVSGIPAPAVTWQVRRAGGTWAPVAGATGRTLEVVAGAAVDGNEYRAVATNSVATAESASARLTVRKAAPVVTQQPADVSVRLGAKATFTAKASGYPAPAVRWESRKGSAAWKAVPGATSTTLTLTASKATDGTQVRAVFTNASGSVTSAVARLSADATRPTITRQPASVTGKVGSTVTFRAGADGHPAPTVQWQRKVVGGSWKAIKGATSTSLKVKVSSSLHKASYRAVFTNSAGSVTSKSAKLTVKAAKPKITKQPRSVTVRAGKAATFSVKATGAPGVTYTWQVKKPRGGWATVKGASSSSLRVVAKASLNGAKYRVVVKNAAGKVTSKSATLKVTARR